MGLLDMQKRMDKIDDNGDALAKLNATVDWEMFRPLLSGIHANAAGTGKTGGAT